VNRQDTATRRVTAGIVLAVALFAAADSFTHIYGLARQHHQDVLSAALLPLAGDGVIAAASAAMLAAARNRTTVPARARVLLWAGIVATVAANLAYGLEGGLTGALLSVWPVAAYVGCCEILAWMQEHLGASRLMTAPRRAPRTDAPGTVKPDAPDAPQDELSGRRVLQAGQTPADLFQAAEAAFPGGMNADTGRPASLRDIQGALGIGQGKAQQVQAHFQVAAVP